MTAQERVTQKTLLIDLQKVSGEEAVTIEYDATSCYDMILPSFASFASQRLGLHEID